MAKQKKLREELEKIEEKKLNTNDEQPYASTTQAIKLHTAMEYLKKNYDFRYNVIANEVEYKSKKEKLYKYFDEFEYNSIQVEMDLKGIHLADNKYRQVLISRFISEKHDPLKEYLFKLPKWNGKTDYIKLFLEQVYLTNETDREYFINGFKKWFVAYVMSFVRDEPDPYFINQVALILVSKQQGKHKSTWLGSIVPEHLRLKYYYPSSFNAHNKDHEKYLATKMLINLDEMAAFNKTDIETMKSKITQPQVVLRLPYGRADIQMKRRASFCGSINDRQFLRDETGSRRWLVIEVNDIKFDYEFNVDGMYSQALAMYREGFKYWFDGEDIIKLESRNMEYTQCTMEEEYLLNAFESPDEKENDDDPKSQIEYITTSEIASKVAKNNDRMNVNNSVVRALGKALTKHKFKRIQKKINNNKYPVYCWRVKQIHLESSKKDVESNNEENDSII
jgi:predicted P-loop ATPase